MNTTPMCEALRSGPWKDDVAEMFDCDLRAEWDVFCKTTATRFLLCDKHFKHSMYITPGHTYVVSPARSRAKRDGKGLTIGEAKKRRVCRVCGEQGAARERSDGTMEAFVLGFGYEHAHEDCMDEEAHQHLRTVLSKRGPFRGD